MIPKIGWQESYNLNIEEIDVQHKKLLAVANELYDLIQGDAASYKNNVSKALKKLTDYTVYHFSSEETFMRKYGYPQSDFHKMHHPVFCIITRKRGIWKGEAAQAASPVTAPPP